MKRDIANINDFFKRQCKVDTLSIKACFDFITDIDIENQNQYLDDLFEKEKDEEVRESNDNVFREVYTPRTLQELEF